MIRLISGPSHNRKIADSGTVQIKIGISKRWQNNRPCPGYESGYAIYEPSVDRSKAFWLTNVWDGITILTEEA